jgi:hypothetical protein
VKVEEDVTSSECTIEEKVAQPDWGASRQGLPMVSYAFAAATSKEASTQLIDSSRETDICARRASITAWSTMTQQSSISRRVRSTSMINRRLKVWEDAVRLQTLKEVRYGGYNLSLWIADAPSYGVTSLIPAFRHFDAVHVLKCAYFT